MTSECTPARPAVGSIVVPGLPPWPFYVGGPHHGERLHESPPLGYELKDYLSFAGPGSTVERPTCSVWVHGYVEGEGLRGEAARELDRVVELNGDRVIAASHRAEVLAANQANEMAQERLRGARQRNDHARRRWQTP